MSSNLLILMDVLQLSRTIGWANVIITPGIKHSFSYFIQLIDKRLIGLSFNMRQVDKNGQGLNFNSSISKYIDNKYWLTEFKFSPITKNVFFQVPGSAATLNQ